MTLSNQDRQRVLAMLDDIDSADVRRITASQSSFEYWFRVRLPDVYRKIAGQIARVWIWIRTALS